MKAMLPKHSSGSDVDAIQTDRAYEAACRGIGVPLAEVEAWVASWDTPGELERPVPRKLL